MDYHWRGIIIVFKIIFFINSIRCETFSVKIGTDNHINTVDRRFLSFTVDPKFLFASNDRLISKDSTCMASALSPAYLRLAGPSVQRVLLTNDSILMQTDKRKVEEVPFHQWGGFAKWTRDNGFDLVYALNNLEKTASGMWDANSALSLLTVADELDVTDVVWQLGYECQNQTIEEYLNDLETLRLIVENFPETKSKSWKVVGSDITPCLDRESKSDFKDYVTLSNHMLDAIFLDGNSSTHELERMSERDKMKLLSLLASSKTPLWLTEQVLDESEMERAASWMYSLGHAARNGFDVYYRELKAEELEQPTLSFYMALLFKNLVGEKVLSAEFEHPSSRASLFAHCTSLRRKTVPGAVTLYGANLDDEPARYSLKLGKKEEGGDILQFILGLDHNGNIVVNGKTMYYEGDIKPVVKRVRPYKTLLINLPPKSFGFWVLANIDACHEQKPDEENKFLEAESIPEVHTNAENEVTMKIRRKRSISESGEDAREAVLSAALSERLDDLNSKLNNVRKIMDKKLHRHERVADSSEYFGGKRDRRQVELVKESKKPKVSSLARRREQAKKEHLHTTASEPKTIGNISDRLARLNAKISASRIERRERLKSAKSKVLKRSPPKKKHNITSKTKETNNTKVVEHREKRSIIEDRKNFQKDIEELLPENEIDVDDEKLKKVGKYLKKVQKNFKILKSKPKSQAVSDEDYDAIEDQIMLKTRFSDDDASIKLSERSQHGFLRQTLNKAFTTFKELNEHFNSLMEAMSLSD